MAVAPSRDQHRRAFRARVAPPRMSRPFANLPAAEWKALYRYRPNVLIEGDESDIEATLVALRGDFGPIRMWSPSACPVAGAVLVREVSRLGHADQQKLVECLNNVENHVQVIATSTTPLYECVLQGGFPANLYYRLATLRLVVGQTVDPIV